MTDHYEVLGLARSATPDDIKGAFRRRANLHPDVDKAPGAADRFARISEAYATLSDPEKRAAYDAQPASASVAGAEVPAEYVEAINFTVDLGRQAYQATRGVDPRAAASAVAEKLTTRGGREQIRTAWDAARSILGGVFAPKPSG